MPRPKKCRRICALPRCSSFGPLEGAADGRVEMAVEEYEAIRLIDLLGCTQEECAAQMGVARSTVQQVYDTARRRLAQALVEGQFSGVVEADDGFYLILRKPVDLEAVAPDYFDALLQAAADSADISTTRTYADLDVSRFYDELIAARAELDASGGEVA